MRPSQALALGLCLIDFEIEEPSYVPVPPEWKKELNAAREILSELIGLFETQPPTQPPPIDWQALPEVMAPKQAAEVLGIHYRSVHRLLREGWIRAAKVGGRYQIDRRDLRAAVESGSLAAKKPGAHRRPNRETHPTLGF